MSENEETQTAAVIGVHPSLPAVGRDAAGGLV